MFDPTQRKKILAITAGFISVLIGLIYLTLIAILDSRGPMLPPPPEAMGVGVILSSFLL